MEVVQGPLHTLLRLVHSTSRQPVPDRSTVGIGSEGLGIHDVSRALRVKPADATLYFLISCVAH